MVRLTASRRRVFRNPGEKISQLGPQVLHRDLAGVFLVDRGEVIERHAVELHLEQLLHRQLAARIGEADHDAIHRSRAHDRGNVFDRRRGTAAGLPAPWLSALA